MVDNEQARRIMAEVVEIARAFEMSGRRQRAAGITGTKIGILNQLKRDDARLTAIADTLGVSLPVASRAVGALEAEGYVIRRTDPDDARASLLSLSPIGVDYIRGREVQFIARFAEQLSDWNDDDAAQAEAALARLREPILATLTPVPDPRPAESAQ
ncbi:MarR family winged helix-turn-helix transcriptional regulator [Gordonia neofelifaecis]|uniref:MarR family transcriptional regulator n=1 Tax=Gordonia neofelifaecis NRRL B-59395 TaxID=644548 RepID=F1YE06_9ACTN|nr:MarR family transcriptional regulator [Gordonia neofelifaecis]EGD57096.1 MarR family transcriptional regulator [Gordonia neofelifaecis NRRL B-59395]